MIQSALFLSFTTWWWQRDKQLPPGGSAAPGHFYVALLNLKQAIWQPWISTSSFVIFLLWTQTWLPWQAGWAQWYTDTQILKSSYLNGITVGGPSPRPRRWVHLYEKPYPLFPCIWKNSVMSGWRVLQTSEYKQLVLGERTPEFCVVTLYVQCYLSYTHPWKSEMYLCKPRDFLALLSPASLICH